MTKIFGITGRKRSGKNTLAGFLQPDTSAHIAFAAAIKRVLLQLNPQVTGHRGIRPHTLSKEQLRLFNELVDSLLVYTSATSSEILNQTSAKFWHMLDILNPFIRPEEGNPPLHLIDIINDIDGYESHKTEGDPIDDEIRRLLQVLGTEVGRQAISDDIWLRTGIDGVRARIDEGYNTIVVTDVRFDNEARAIRELGGKIIEITRPDLPDEDRHASEAGVSSELIDILLHNDRDLATLRKDAAIIAALQP